MINSFLKYKLKNIVNDEPSINDIHTAKKVLFVLLTRYGDTIISLQVIKEFVDLYPEKKYLILVPKQMIPYIKELLPNIDVLSVNKRNISDMLKVNYILKKENFDIGFNPWSNGIDSCYFISYCKKFLFYKDFQKNNPVNHYEVVRNYLRLPSKNWKIGSLVLKESYTNILVCPQSTDLQRSIDGKQLNSLLLTLNERYPKSNITIASMDQSYFRKEHQEFLFSKSAQSSENFINLVKQSDLVCCSDSGPLHIALSLQKDTIALFNITKPDIVLNTDSKVKINL